MKELHDKTAAELERLLAEKRNQLAKFRFEMSGGKVKNVKEGANLRKDIARIMTAISKNK